MPRLFRLKLRRGRAMLTATSDPARETPTSAGAGEEVVVSEQTAVFLVGQRAAEIVEIIETGEGHEQATQGTASGTSPERSRRRGTCAILSQNRDGRA